MSALGFAIAFCLENISTFVVCPSSATTGAFLLFPSLKLSTRSSRPSFVPNAAPPPHFSTPWCTKNTSRRRSCTKDRFFTLRDRIAFPVVAEDATSIESLSRVYCGEGNDPRTHVMSGFKLASSKTATAAVLISAATSLISQPSVATVTGGRIGGGFTPQENFLSIPPLQQQQPRESSQTYRGSPSRPGPSIDSGGDIRVHISYRGDGPGPRRLRRRVSSNPDIGDARFSRITAGDAAMIGSITAGIVALQRYNRNRYDEMGRLDGSSLNTRRGWGTAEGTETPALTKLQMALFIEHREGRRDMLSTLKVLSQSADVNTRGGLAALVDEVCLALLRLEEDWVGATGSIKIYTSEGRRSDEGKRLESSPIARAKRDFNRGVTRERAKWERETISKTPNSMKRSAEPAQKEATRSNGGTYAVVTLMIGWSGLRSSPPSRETQKSAWFPRDGNMDGDDKNVLFSVGNRQLAVAMLEWLSDEIAEGRGQNVLDVEVLWAPAEEGGRLDLEDLHTKWPELREI